ncbi:LysR family transcriptional regulator [Alloalcanivorax marinus]|uniref:LysR family transcriptional regulator n=1 Tax=Alloalcanivorax marinus TaxID=1177169 RepID=UPI0021D38D51|nr:LysR family transcriptional regulator [Alloalcanivorax marinus]MCU5785240.1 putative transcriptional regulator [Alloalcanivorax marinus]
MSTAYLSRLTLRQLRIFLTVCQQESYSRAAEELALTQPAVSAQVRNLEELIGEPLFDYVGRRLSLTPAGQAMRRAGQDLMQRLGQAEMELAELRGVMQGTLSLAVESSAQYFMPDRIAAFCRRHPDVEVRMRVMNHGEALKSLREERHDLTIMGLVPDDRRLSFVPFRQNRLVAVARPDHPLAGVGDVSLNRFLAFPLLVREPGSGSRRVFEALYQSRGLRPSRCQQLGSLESIKAGVRAGLGLAVLPREACDDDLEAGRLVTLIVEGLPLKRSWCVVHPRARQLTPVAEAFFQALTVPERG